jgi:glycosyltransferase 2 family protein
MAAGGLLAAVGFLFLPAGGTVRVDLGLAAVGPDPSGAVAHEPARALIVPALGAGVGLLALVLPGTFPRLAGLIRRPLRGVGADALPRLSAGLLGEGLCWASAGWVLLGLSQVAVIAGVKVWGTTAYPLGPDRWPIVVASVALATVAGFAIPIAPGGLGVREWVLWTALGALIDRDRAVVAALVLRLVWVAAEVVAAAALLPIRPKARPAA